MKRWAAGMLAALTFVSTLSLVGAGGTAAFAGPSSQLQLSKKVDGVDAVRDLVPGTTVTFSVNFSVENENVVGPVTLTDVMPEAFEGWEILGMSARVNGSADLVTVNLPGVTPADAGTIGTGEAARTITVDIARPIPGGSGMSADDQGVLTYQVKIPENLPPTWYANNVDLVNTAEFTAEALSETDTAIISVDVPVTPGVTPAKSWTPSEQGFQPGASSTVTIGGTQSSNVDAVSLSLQDPADPSFAPDGAATLPAGNPFNFVDFTGFTTDPTTNLPAGATDATVEVYYFDGTEWSWTEWDATLTNSNIAGVRTLYTGTIPSGASVSQSFGVEQRLTNRSDDSSISAGYTVTNEVQATVVVDGFDPVSDEAPAQLVVSPEQIDVEAGKSFLDPATGEELTALTAVGGDTVNVVLHARNKALPLSTTLDSLTIREPGSGADAAYFSEDLEFAGFNNSTPSAAWPNGATTAVVTWHTSAGDVTSATLNAGDSLPAAPAGATILGFEITYTGDIAPYALADVTYAIHTNEDLGEANAPAGPFLNIVEVEGERMGLDTVTDTANANLTIVAPSIDVTINKRVSPSIVEPGDDVIVQLPTTATTSGSQTKPTEIVVTDAFTGAGTFWDAYNATKIIAPVQVHGGTLLVEWRDASGAWATLDTFTSDIAADIDLSTYTAIGNITGLRFTFSKTDGFGTSTTVKPNIGFEARSTLRTGGGTTTPEDFEPTPYENLATAEGTGTLGHRTVEDTDDDTVNGSIRPVDAFDGVLWADKEWQEPTTLVSQSGATPSSLQRWALTATGYETVHLADPRTPTANGVGTVFEAFNLLRVKPITLAQDPALMWDSVTAVELYDGTSWVAVTPPASGWMGSNGFIGYTLTAGEQASALGIRLTIEENTAARQAAADTGDIGAPALGSGVTASASIRGYTLDWQLRDRARGTAADAPKWVTDDATFNCSAVPGDPGCIDNVFGVTATLPGGSAITTSDNDQITLVDGVPSVGLVKTVTNNALVAPIYGDIDQADYPTTRFTLTAQNTSAAVSVGDDSAAGRMKLSRLRVTDVASSTLGNTAMNVSPFAGRDFASEAANNHFDQFNVTDISFGTLPDYIDKSQSQVELWVDGTGIVSYSITEIEAGAADAHFPNVIGVAVTYQGTDPELNGNRILAGAALTMHIDVQLRETHRVSGAAITGGPVGSAVRVENDAFALGEDHVVNPDATPTDSDEAYVDLTDAAVDVHLEKSIAVTNTLPGTNSATVYEAEPQAPVTVTLTATPGASTAPLDTLTLSDTTPAFWSQFEFVSFGTAGNPSDADRSVNQVFDGTDWIDVADYTGDTADIVGVRTIFDRVDGALFPLGATSWSSGWGTATAPFTVKLRADAVVDWVDPTAVENLASAYAEHSTDFNASDTDDAEVDFSGGTNALQVTKRAPNDEGNHQINPLDSMPWKLAFTNTGSSLLPIEFVTDVLPSTLRWDGEQPTFVSSGPAGLSTDPADITVELSDDGNELVFTWPDGSRMEPGETMTIELGLVLQPGLSTGQRATNEVIVTAGAELNTCTQPTNNGQAPGTPSEANECSNTNYVEPLVGTYVNGLKTVNGEIVETNGEFLVDGGTRAEVGTRLPTGEACTTSNWTADGYTRAPCIAYTAVGATDSWKLEYHNIGTNALNEMVIVDMLPRPGDKLLAGYDFTRASNFRPVIDSASIELFNLPSGTDAIVEVTTDPATCYSTGRSNPERWTDDPTCSNTSTNPANGSWVELGTYLADGGLDADIAGLRVTLHMTAVPLAPGSTISLQFETSNKVVGQTSEGLQPTLADFETPRVAWNQSGVMAWDIYGTPIPLPKAPPVAGVTVKTADLVVSKDVLGDTRNAPATFTVGISCTIPDGNGDRVDLDLGDYALLEVPGNLPGTDPADRLSVTVPGLPIGANCVASELIDPATGPVFGEFGEIGRSIESADGVNPATDGLSAELRIRDNGAGSEPAAATLLTFANTYGVGDLVIEKAVRSTTHDNLSAEQREQTFDFEVVCVAGATTDTRTVSVKAGEQFVVDELPAGALCEITELDARGASLTTSTVDGISADGTSRADVVLAEDGTYILFTNSFVPDLPVTGGSNTAAWFVGLGVGVLLLGGLMLVVAKRRSARVSIDGGAHEG